jgi:short-subunit dehydrogenase
VARAKVAYVVGGSTGIGLAVAEKLAARGDHVALFARREGPLAEAARAVEARRRDAAQRIAWRALDAADAGRVREGMDDVLADLGAPDLLVNCAGRAIPNYFDRISVEQLDETLRQNLHTCWNSVASLVPHMKQRGGHVVNVSSLAGLIGVFGYTDYCAAKFAVVGFSEALRWELAPHRIAVSVLCPPDVDTPGLAREEATKPHETRVVSAGAGMLTPAAVADALLAGVARRRFLILPGSEGRLAWWAKRLSPALVDALVARRLRGARQGGA